MHQQDTCSRSWSTHKFRGWPILISARFDSCILLSVLLLLADTSRFTILENERCDWRCVKLPPSVLADEPPGYRKGLKAAFRWKAASLFIGAYFRSSAGAAGGSTVDVRRQCADYLPLGMACNGLKASRGGRQKPATLGIGFF